jgi:hypothetical protein
VDLKVDTGVPGEHNDKIKENTRFEMCNMDLERLLGAKL